MDINERIKDQLESHHVMLYMKGTPDFPQCGFSRKVVLALRRFKVKFDYFDIFSDWVIKEQLKEYANW